MYAHCSMKFFMAIEMFGNTRRYPGLRGIFHNRVFKVVVKIEKFTQD